MSTDEFESCLFNSLGSDFSIDDTINHVRQLLGDSSKVHGDEIELPSGYILDAYISPTDEEGSPVVQYDITIRDPNYHTSASKSFSGEGKFDDVISTVRDFLNKYAIIGK